MESATIPAQGAPVGARERDKGLKAGALGRMFNLVIGVACGVSPAGGDDRLVHPDAA